MMIRPDQNQVLPRLFLYQILAETQAELDALLPAVLDKAFKGEL